MSTILTILGWLLAPVCSALVVYVREQRKLAAATAEAASRAKSEHDEAMEQGMVTLLRQQLVDYHRDYVASGRACPVTIKEQATEVYEAYHALGGNGTGTRLWEEIMGAHVA